MSYMRIATVAAALAIASPLAAQGRGKPSQVPPGQRPPAGMCRIWIDGVPPGQQPAPTDCATAVARRPANARIIYGDRENDQQTSSILFPNTRRNDQNCFQQLDRSGQVRTMCDDEKAEKPKKGKGRGGDDRDE